MKQLELIKNILQKSGADYRLYKVPNDVGPSVDEHIKAFGLDYSDGCATLIFSTDNGFIALLRRDDTKINNTKLRKAVNTNKLRFASAVELKQVTGYPPGMVSPLTLEIPIYMDEKVLKKNKVRVGSGTNEYSLEMHVEDIKRITNAKVIDVTEIDDAKRGNLRVLSGITPSSSKGLHLGNYLGAVKSHIEFQDKGECFYFIADYHALNTVHDPKVFQNNVIETFIDYLALGIDLEKTTFFVESTVKDIFELTEILNNVVTLSQMKRMHAYKDKLNDPNADIDNINMGLFNYPILMAADILAFEPDIVPVGEDQAQHVEICRDIAQSFNYRYGKILKVPELYIKPSVARVPGTDGVRKMSKSLGNDLTIFADEDTLRRQVMAITTDPNRIHKDDPGDPEKNVIFKYFRLMDYNEERISELEDQYREGTVGDTTIKEEFYDFFLKYFTTYRDKRAVLATDKNHIVKLIQQNGEKARQISNQTLLKVRKSIGSIF